MSATPQCGMHSEAAQAEAVQTRHIEVAAGILWRGDRFLAVTRPSGKVQAGAWEFPGGKLEPAESAEDAVKRELLEELGVRVRIAVPRKSLSHTYAERRLHVTLHFFDITAFDGEPLPLEGQELRWLLPGTACADDFLEADRPLVLEIAAAGSPVH